jgi:histidinol-phosphatase (PHP family)
MKADYHMHTRFSADSENDPEELIKECMRRGLKTICITDHHDIDFVDPGFVVDFDPYFETLRALQEKYRGQIEVLIGMEYGLQAHLGEASAKLAKQYGAIKTTNIAKALAEAKMAHECMQRLWTANW